MPRGSVAAGPRDFPRQHCGRRAARGAADACAAVARLGGGETILETGSGDQALQAVTTEPLVPENPAVSGRPASHDDVSCFLPLIRDNSSRRRSFEETTLDYLWHAEGGARVAPLPPAAVERDRSFASNESDGPGESSWEKEFLDWTEECAGGAALAPQLETSEAARRTSCAAPPTPPALAQTAKLTEDVRPKYGNISLRYLGGSKVAHQSEPHEDGSKTLDIISPRDDGHSRGSGKRGGRYNLFSRSSSRDDGHSCGSGGDDAHSRASGGDDGHFRASGGDDGHSRGSGGHYNFFSRSSTRKERGVAAATSAASAVATAAAAAAVVPEEPSLIARQITTGSTGTLYCGSESSLGDPAADRGFPARYHDPLSASPHARAFPPQLPHPPSPSITGVAAAAAAATPTTAAAAEADINAMKKRLGAMMQFSTWEQQQKERKQQQDAAASAAQRALRQAQEELLFPKFHAPGHAEPPHAPQQAPQNPPHHAPNHKISPPKSSTLEAKLLEAKLLPGVPTFGATGSAEAWRAVLVGLAAVWFGLRAEGVATGVWGGGGMGGEATRCRGDMACGAGRRNNVGKVDREGDGAWRNNWECGSVGWDQGGSYSLGSTAHHYSPPVSHVSHGYADSAAGAATAAFVPSPPGSAATASSSGISSGHVAPSNVAPSNVASGHFASGVGSRVFSPEQLITATNGFHSSNLLGAGAFGQVFKGSLLGCDVAIKRLEGSGWQGEEEYSTEVHVLSRMRHPHIVLLMGHCPAINCLVYEFLPGGDLSQHLCSAASAGGASGDRIRILSEISGALLYLHQHAPPIAHRDLKPQNILLDTSLRAKLADVGLARLIDSSGTSTNSRWTRHLTTSLQRAVNVIIERLEDSGGKWDRGAAAEVAAIAISCTNRRRASRPDLEREVHEVLMQLAEESAGCVERRRDGADNHLLCLLSKMRMREPVVAADGYTYEKKEIEKWMETNSRSPITGELFVHPMLTPNNAMNVIIQ
ncbi:unnamed protein product [Closterium sp. Naga37s-1]|nr:unnamed protein product [Closterium sp. Naga37s-1]